MRIVEFECLKCGKIQEKILKRLSDKNKECCNECSASAENLRRCVYHPRHKQHISWSKWRV